MYSDNPRYFTAAVKRLRKLKDLVKISKLQAEPSMVTPIKISSVCQKCLKLKKSPNEGRHFEGFQRTSLQKSDSHSV